MIFDFFNRLYIYIYIKNANAYIGVLANACFMTVIACSISLDKDDYAVIIVFSILVMK